MAGKLKLKNKPAKEPAAAQSCLSCDILSSIDPTTKEKRANSVLDRTIKDKTSSRNSTLTEAEQNRLIHEHMHLVRVTATAYRGTIEFEDLLGIGREGLVKAARNFDGGDFKIWAITRIRSEISHAIESGKYASLGEEAIPFTSDSIEKIFEYDVWGERGNASAIAEMWSSLDASPEELSILYDDVKEKRAKFEAAFMSLSGNQRKLITWVYLIDPVMSVADAARELGVSYKQAIRMLKKALTTMRQVITRMEVNRISGGNANGHPLNDGLHGCVSGDNL